MDIREEVLTLARLKGIEAAARVTRSPGIRWRALALKYERQLDPVQLSVRYGLKSATIRRLASEQLDYPGFRFHRDARFYDYFAKNIAAFRGSSWLDVGADVGAVDVYLSEMLFSEDFELCDVNIARHTTYPVKKISGTSLEYEANSFDLVFFTYVLHHAADDTIALLRDAHRIARKHVIVLEDPKETTADYRWAYKHDKQATFRGLKEWRELFSLLGFGITYETPLGDDIHSRHFFLLTPRNG